MNLDEAIKGFQTAKIKVVEAVRASNEAKTKLKECEEALKESAKIVTVREEAVVATRAALRNIADRIGPLLASEVSGMCGKAPEP